MKKSYFKIISLLLAVVMIAGSLNAVNFTAKAADTTSEEIIVDVGDNVVGEKEYIEEGTWSDSGDAVSHYSKLARYCGTSGASATWKALIPEAGNYEVYIWSVNAKYSPSTVIEYDGKIIPIAGWTTAGTGGWYQLEDASFEKNEWASVKLYSSSNYGGTIRASAVKFVKKPDVIPEVGKDAPLIIDNDAVGFETTGEGWTPSGLAGYSGTQYSQSEGAIASWCATFKEAGLYQIYYYHVIDSNPNSIENKGIEVSVTDGTVSETLEKDWSEEEAGWKSLGMYQFDTGTEYKVQVKNTIAQNFLRVDAIKIVYVQEKTPVSYNLDTGNYLLTTAGDTAKTIQVTKDGQTTENNPGDLLSEAGTYSIVRNYNEVLCQQTVNLYRIGDVNFDNAYNADDVTLMKEWVLPGGAVTTDETQKKAADLNNDGAITNDDLKLLQDIVKDTTGTERNSILNKYYAEGKAYDGSEMPIALYDESANTDTSTIDFTNVTDSGINVLNLKGIDYNTSGNDTALKEMLKTAEEKSIGVYVKDAGLSADNFSTRLGAYSYYDSFLGTDTQDIISGPYTNISEYNDTVWGVVDDVTKADLQVNTALAEGKKGIQWNLTATELSTNKDKVTAVNNWVKRVQDVLMKSVYKGNGLYGKVTAISDNTNILAGFFDYQGKTAVYLVNNSAADSQTVTLTTPGHSRYQVIREDGTADVSTGLTGMDVDNQGTIAVNDINPGQAVLVVIEEEDVTPTVQEFDPDDYAKYSNTYPELKGYIFAGWFTNGDDLSEENMKIYAVKVDEKYDTYYAKYVDENILTVKAQVKDNTGTADLRLVTSVDNLAYKNIGFEITNESISTRPTFAKDSNKVYKVLKAKAEDKEILTYKPTAFYDMGANCQSTYFATLNITNVASKNYEDKLNVVPYWTTLDGTKVYGIERTLSISEGIPAKDSSAE